MAYTASALSFMLEYLGKPVILTGSQVRTLTGSQVRILIGSQVRILPGSQVRTLTGSQERILTGSQVRTLTGSQVRTLATHPSNIGLSLVLSGCCICVLYVSLSGYFIYISVWVLYLYLSRYCVSVWALYTNTISGYCICFNLGTVSVYCSYLFLGTVSVYCICLFLGTLSGSVSLLYPLLMGYCVCLLYLGTVSGMVLSSSGSMLYLLTIPGGTISIGFCAWKSQLGDTLRGIYMLFTYAYTCILH